MFASKFIALALAAAASVSAAPLAKRDYSGRATYYAVGLGACGGTNSDSEMVVALNTAQYGNTGVRSSWCGKRITISNGGNTQTATVVDACPTCSYGSLDMSPALFSALTNGNMGLGVFQMSWHEAGSGSSSSNSNNNNGNQRQAAAPATTSSSSQRQQQQQQQTQQAQQASSSASQTPRPSSSSSSAAPASTPSAARNATFAGIEGKQVSGVPSWWAEVGTAGCPGVVVPSNSSAVAIAPTDLMSSDDMAAACGRTLTIVNPANNMTIQGVVTSWVPGAERNSIVLADGYKQLANVSSSETPGAIEKVVFGYSNATSSTSN
jgi:expansin (peptidoglycan-binding protein)